ncbi:hypothetical protein D3C71_2139790 [compost metagenome]
MVEIAAKRSFHLPEDSIKHLVKQDREWLIDALVQEFSEAGLGPDDEPNQRGVEIEEIIDFVGAIADETDASSD